MKLAVTGICILSLMSGGALGQTNGGATGYLCGVAKCNSCQANICTGCVQGYYLNLGMCKNCPFGCASCNLYGACTACKEGYGMGSSGSCFTCAEGCATCDAYNACKNCRVDYEMSTANGRNQCLFRSSAAATGVFLLIIGCCCCCPLLICCVCVFVGKSQAESQSQNHPNTYMGHYQPQAGYPGGYDGVQMGGAQQPGYGGFGQQQYY